MNYGYTVNTNVVGDEIHQEVLSVCGDVIQSVHRSVINTAEAQIRQALIDLGWTPPAKKEQDNG